MAKEDKHIKKNDKRYARELLQATIDSLPDEIHVMEAVRNEQGRIIDFRWLLMNRAAIEKFGDLTGDLLRAHHPAVLDESIFEGFKQVAETGIPLQYEKHHHDEDVDVWVHQSVAKLNDGIVNTTRVVTENKKTVLASEKRLMDLNENLGQQVKKRTKELTRLKGDQEKEILNAIIFTQEQERARISEGLHDGVAQLLYAAQSRLQLVKPGNTEKELKEALHILTEAIQETRKVSFELMPPVLRDYGLEVCLKTLADRIAGGKLLLLWDINIPGRLPEKLEITIYRIVQEILNNILKHAGATVTRLSLRLAGKYLYLKVTDNGCGFALKRSKSAYTGTGLQSIRNRVKLLNGKISISSTPGHGTNIESQLPLRGG